MESDFKTVVAHVKSSSSPSVVVDESIFDCKSGWPSGQSKSLTEEQKAVLPKIYFDHVQSCTECMRCEMSDLPSRCGFSRGFFGFLFFFLLFVFCKDRMGRDK